MKRYLNILEAKVTKRVIFLTLGEIQKSFQYKNIFFEKKIKIGPV